MAKIFTLINTSVDSFGAWLSKTNSALAAFANTVTLSNDSSPDVSTGNGFVVGALGGNIITANSSLRGGNVTTAANLTITSNVSFTGANVYAVGNVGLAAANVYINSNSFVVAANSSLNAVVITSNSTVVNVKMTANIITIAGNSTFVNSSAFNAPMTINSDLTITTGEFALGVTSFYANSVTLTGTSAQEVDRFDPTDYRGGKYVLSMKDNANSAFQLTEVMVLQDGSSTYTTEYSTLRSTANNLGVVSAVVNSTACVVKVAPTIASMTVKLTKNVLEI